MSRDLLPWAYDCGHRHMGRSWRSLRGLPLFLLCLALAPVAGAADQAAFRLVKDAEQRPIAVELWNLSEELLTQQTAALSPNSPAPEQAASSTGSKPGPNRVAPLFSLHVADDDEADLPPALLGKYERIDQALRFTPRYAFRPGLTYRAVLSPHAVAALKLKPGGANGTAGQRFDFSIPEVERNEAAEVTAIYPSAQVLPENTLRFYLHFTRPMSRGEAYAHLELLDNQDQPVELPFLELGEELWDRSGRRLTLLIDPGRIKQGVKPREDLGTALLAGKTFTLVVHSGWRSADGDKSRRAMRKTFRVVEPAGTRIAFDKWKYEIPAAGSRDPLVVQFDRTLDRALAERTIRMVRLPQSSDGTQVGSEQETAVAGQVEVGAEERNWKLTPEQVWQPGRYELRVDPELEDVAGNRISTPFEVDREAEASVAIQREPHRKPFEIRSAAR